MPLINNCKLMVGNSPAKLAYLGSKLVAFDGTDIAQNFSTTSLNGTGAMAQEIQIADFGGNTLDAYNPSNLSMVVSFEWSVVGSGIAEFNSSFSIQAVSATASPETGQIEYQRISKEWDSGDIVTSYSGNNTNTVENSETFAVQNADKLMLVARYLPTGADLTIRNFKLIVLNNE